MAKGAWVEKKVITARQRECLFALAEGSTVKEIAYQLGIKPRTVNYHLSVVRDKMAASTFEEMIYRYFQKYGFSITRQEITDQLAPCRDALELHSK